MLGASWDLSEGPVVHTLGSHNSTLPVSFHLILLVSSFHNPQSSLPERTCVGTIDFVIDHVASKGVVSVKERRHRETVFEGDTSLVVPLWVFIRRVASLDCPGALHCPRPVAPTRVPHAQTSAPKNRWRALKLGVCTWYRRVCNIKVTQDDGMELYILRGMARKTGTCRGLFGN